MKNGIIVAIAIASLSVAISAKALSTENPLPVVPGETIAKWSFDGDTVNQVLDEVDTPDFPAVNGEAFDVNLIDSDLMGLEGGLFGNAREFTGAGSFIDLGTVTSSTSDDTKLNLQGRSTIHLEAVVQLTADAPDTHTIFDNRQIQLKIVDNRLAGYVRQSAGFKGLVAEEHPLNGEQAFRVGMALKDQVLTLTINSTAVANVAIEEPIYFTEPGTKAFIGLQLPGRIDDIRLSQTVDLDVDGPEVVLESPDISLPLIDPRPDFRITYSDPSGVDGNSVRLMLNGIEQIADSNLIIDGAKIEGRMNQELISGEQNTVEIEVKDSIGNTTQRIFNISFLSVLDGTEFPADPETLLLLHLNDFDPDRITDASPSQRHGVAKDAPVIPGMFGPGRAFHGLNTSRLVLPHIPIPGHEFTFDAWIQPAKEGTLSSEETLFDNGQIRISRFGTGHVRILLETFFNSYEFETTNPLLGIGQLRQLRVTYDGNREEGNLRVWIDGILADAFNAPAHCDFDPTPTITEVGTRFSGFIDEVRLSSVVRETFYLITGHRPRITLAFPQEGHTVSESRPGIHIRIDDPAGVNPSDLELRLNGALQPESADLVFHPDRIIGKMEDSLAPGPNVLEIRARNLNGMETLEKKVFHHVEKGNSQEYSPDSSTVGLWHLNESQADLFLDSSGNGYDGELLSSGAEVVPGVYSNARNLKSSYFRVNGIKISGREMTWEAWLNVPDTATNGFHNLFSLTGTGCHISVSRNDVGTLEARLQFQSGENLTTRAPNVLPLDDQFHHFALVYDGSRGFSNLHLIIDGVVVHSRDLHAVCDHCFEEMRMTVGQFNFPNGVMDEIRLSSSARYELSSGEVSGKPTIAIVKGGPETTFHEANPNVEYLFSDPDGINGESVSVEINGVQEEGLIRTESGGWLELSGSLGNSLIPGANQVVLRGKDMTDKEVVHEFVVYYLSQGEEGPYPGTDPETLGLWHMDETGGSGSQILLLDGSGNGRNWTGPSASLVPGVFDEALAVISPQLNYQAPQPEIPGNQVTWEAWVRIENDFSTRTLLDFPSASSRLQIDLNQTALELSLRDSAVGITSLESHMGVIPRDGQFHHVAVVIDGSHPVRNLLMLVNGKVIASKKWAFSGPIAANPEGTMRMNLLTVLLDEVRLSHAARYELRFGN